MPYILPERREAARSHPVSPGELNFAVTSILMRYLKERNLSYQTINDILGALEGAKLEFYRRVALPYENRKRRENGDVYDQDVLQESDDVEP